MCGDCLVLHVQRSGLFLISLSLHRRLLHGFEHDHDPVHAILPDVLQRLHEGVHAGTARLHNQRCRQDSTRTTRSRRTVRQVRKILSRGESKLKTRHYLVCAVASIARQIVVPCVWVVCVRHGAQTSETKNIDITSNMWLFPMKYAVGTLDGTCSKRCLTWLRKQNRLVD